jgi:hypothetical protein
MVGFLVVASCSLVAVYSQKGYMVQQPRRPASVSFLVLFVQCGKKA